MFGVRHTPASGTDALTRLTWQDFEHLLAEHYREQGYRVEHHAPGTSLKTRGEGVDLRLRRGNESVIVQCRHWDTAEVPLQEVNDLLSTMLNEAANAGVLVTRGRFTADAMAVARRQPRLQLMDGDVLRVLLKLPDHLDVSLPGNASAAPATRKAKAPARRRRTTSNYTATVVIALMIAVLLGLLIWRILTPRVVPVAVDPATMAPAHPIPAPVVIPPPVAPVTPPPTPAPAATTKRGVPARPPGEPVPTWKPQHEDAMKVMERNTREVGSPD